MKHSLRFKVFRMNIIAISAAVIVLMIFGIYQVRKFAGIMEQTNVEQNSVIMDTMLDSMEDIATEDFQKYVVSEAKVLDSQFSTIQHDLEVLAGQVKNVLEYPMGYAGASVPLPSKKNAGELCLQLVFSEDANSTDSDLMDQVRLIGGLGSMMLEMVSGFDSLIDCVVSLPGGASIIADDSPESKFMSNGEILPFNSFVRPWYVGALVHEKPYFTPVNTDAFTGDSQIMVGVPVFLDGELAAVCGGTIRMETMGNIVSAAQLGEYTDSCLINETGNVLYSSRKDGELGLEANLLKSLKESSNAELVSLVSEALEGDIGFSLITIDGENTYIAYAPVETVGWTQLLTISQEDLNRTGQLLMEKTDSVMDKSLSEVRQTEKNTVLTILTIAGALLLLSVITSMLLANGLVRPIRSMTESVSQIHGDDMLFRVEDDMRTGDEIEVLAKSFESMSEKMQGYVREIVSITSEKQRLETELSVAAQIQENMLPSHFPAFPDRHEFDLYAVMDPAREVGGDFYDYFLLDEDHLAIVVADVSGKGVPAALFMVISKTMIKNVALSGTDVSPAEILEDVNNRLCEGNEESMFVTVWLGILTISTGCMVSACAGHEYPVFYRKGEGFVMEKDSHGLAMGGMEGVEYKNVHWKLDPGNLLFLYSDGVPEANDSAQELFGNDRMLSSLEQSLEEVAKDGETDGMDLQQFLAVFRTKIDDFVGDTPQFDDMTMFCLEYRGEDGFRIAGSAKTI